MLDKSNVHEFSCSLVLSLAGSFLFLTTALLAIFKVLNMWLFLISGVLGIFIFLRAMIRMADLLNGALESKDLLRESSHSRKTRRPLAKAAGESATGGMIAFFNRHRARLKYRLKGSHPDFPEDSPVLTIKS